ncbi:MAG: tetratricopeptide repeat protein [Acidobacteria bacterium]|nr:tetratricopeptide repeat protein [Acidobacteriota bacterium]
MNFVAVNRIEGVVYDPHRMPVEKVYVELLNDVESVIGRTRTNAVGRFSFLGMPPGRFIIKVLPLGTNMMEQTQEVQISNATRTSNDTAYIDIYLRYEKRSGGENEATREVLFVQDVPDAAKKLYQEGVSEIGKNPQKAMAKLEEALRIFPQYFDALNWMGKAYISQKNYEKAYPYLMRAIDVNNRNYSTYYSLGFAFYQLKQYPAALEAARATTLLAPDSVDTQLLHGTLLRITGEYSEAEKALLKSNTLAKGANGEIHWQLALLYNRLNRTQDTINELQVYLKLVPDTPDKAKIQEMIVKLKASAAKKN